MAGLLAQIVGYLKQIADKYKATAEKNEQLYGNKITEIRDKFASAVSTLDQKANNRGATLTGLLGLDQKLASKTSEPEAPAIPEVPKAPKTAPAPSKPAVPEVSKAPKAQSEPQKLAVPEASKAPKAQPKPQKFAAPEVSKSPKAQPATPQPAAPEVSKAQPATPKPAAHTEKLDDSEFELTPEEMERILKRFDELENLIKKSASQSCTSSATTSSYNGRIEILDSFFIPNVYYARHDKDGKIQIGENGWNKGKILVYDSSATIYRASDGKYYRNTGLVGSNQNSNGTTPTAIKEIAEGLGLPVDKEAKKLTIVQQIIERFGHIHNRLYFKGDGNVYNVTELDLAWLRSFLSNQELISEIYTNDAMKIDPNWDDWEFAHKAADYIRSLKRNDKEIYG